MAVVRAGLEVWVVYDAAAAKVRRQWSHLRGAAMRRGWTVREVLASRLKSASGRPLTLLDQSDATQLYRALHRGHVAVLAVVEAHVRRDPRARADPGSLIRIAEFVRYKAYVQRGGIGWSESQFDEFCSQAETWHDSRRCESERDPRCLPFQTFNIGERAFDLDIVGERDSFSKSFGTPTRRLDSGGAAWQRTQAYHGLNDPLVVAGCPIRSGFHWDVSGGGRRIRVMNSSEVWEVDGLGYVNVYPDAYVRRGAQARRVSRA